MDIAIDAPEAIIDLFFQAIKPNQNQIISFYVPMNKEFDCWPLMEAANQRGYTCALPVVRKGTRLLDFAKWTPDTEMEQGAYNIPQPKNADDNIVIPDILIIPLLAFDRRGYRLGMGGGYFDTTLAALRGQKPITAVGTGHAQQACLFNLPTEVHDQKMDWVITPQATHYFGE